MTAALVPMKDLRDAKQRLSSILFEDERKGLVNAMLRDVLAALANARNIHSVSIIAHDRDFLDFGVGFVEEAKNAGYNEAVGFALGRPEFAGTSAILVLPGDIPLVTPSEIDALAAKQKNSGVPKPTELQMQLITKWGTASLLKCSCRGCDSSS